MQGKGNWIETAIVPTVMSGVMIGSNPEMTASARLVDARTRETIIAYPKIEAVVIVGHGIVGTAVQAAMDGAMQQSLETRVINEYCRQYREWLIRA